MSPESIDSFLESFVRLHLTRISIGPCGMQWAFAPDDRGDKSNITRMIFIQSPLRIAKEKITVYESYPREPDEEKLRGLLINSQIDRIGIDPDNNSLRVLFNKQILASAFPTPDEEYGYWWSIHDVTTNPESGFVVCKNKISDIIPPATPTGARAR